MNWKVKAHWSCQTLAQQHQRNCDSEKSVRATDRNISKHFETISLWNFGQNWILNSSAWDRADRGEQTHTTIASALWTDCLPHKKTLGKTPVKKYRWVPLNPNMPKIEIGLCSKYSQNLSLLTHVLICSLNSKYFYLVYQFRIKRDPPVLRHFALAANPEGPNMKRIPPSQLSAGIPTWSRALSLVQLLILIVTEAEESVGHGRSPLNHLLNTRPESSTCCSQEARLDPMAL